MFSQTGTELAEVCKRINRWPDLIYTTNKDISKINSSLHEQNIKVMSHDQIVNEIRSNTYSDDDFITLHGYLRILPELPIVAYNGHPGDIELFPELKGKDPQQKALDLGLEQTGCIIHKVTQELDGGPIVKSSAAYLIQDNETIDSLVANLRKISIELWVEFLTERGAV